MNRCTFRAILNVRRASQPNEGSLQETKRSRGVRESQPLGFWVSKGNIRSTRRDCSGSWWLLSDCLVVSSTGKANEEPGGRDKGACYLCIVGGWVASALNWHRDRQDKGTRVSDSSWKLRRTGPLLHRGGGVNWSLQRGKHWTGPNETTKESEEDITSCPLLSYVLSLLVLAPSVMWLSPPHLEPATPPLAIHPAPIPAHGFLKWLSGKESAHQCRRHWRSGFNPWVGKIPWGRTSDPVQDSCLENPNDRGSRCAIVQRVAKSQTRRGMHTYLHMCATMNLHSYSHQHIFHSKPGNTLKCPPKRAWADELQCVYIMENHAAVKETGKISNINIGRKTKLRACELFVKNQKGSKSENPYMLFASICIKF